MTQSAFWIGIFCFLGVAVAQLAGVPCGVSMVEPLTKRIVGGVVAAPGSWPWVILIVNNYGIIAGSGLIIDPHVILTTAQHFQTRYHSLESVNLPRWRMYAGEFNISSGDPYEKFYNIRRVILHPNYNATTLEDDIALIFTVDEIDWNEHTRPGCLADAKNIYSVGEMCYLPGWGSTSGTGDEEIMNQLVYPILGDSVCQDLWNEWYFPDTEICAGYQSEGKDFCGDDIGSPLMCKSASGAWYAQGLASSGGSCKTAHMPGIFKDISMYNKWILETMEEAGYPYQY